MVSKKQKVDYHYCDRANLNLANTKKLQHVQLLLLSLLVLLLLLLLCALLLLLLLLDGTVCCCLFAAVVDDVLTFFLCVRHEVSSFTETIHPPSVPPHMFVLPSLPSLFFSVVASIPRSPRATKKKKKGNEHHVFSFFHDSIRPLSP